MAAVPVHVDIFEPAFAAGGSYHVITLVSVAFTQPLVPVNVSVAVNDPEAVDGVNIASAGLVFCVHVPSPPPPLHVGMPLYVPLAVAPVIGMAAVPVHVDMSGPALAMGCVPHVMSLVSVAFEHPLAPVSVNVAVNDPEAAVGVNVARAGLAFCVHAPSPVPPLHAGSPL